MPIQQKLPGGIKGENKKPGEEGKNPHDLRSKDKQDKEEQEKKEITTTNIDPPGATANPPLTTEMLQQSFQDFATKMAKDLEEL